MSLLSKIIDSIKAKNQAKKVLVPSFSPLEYQPGITAKKGTVNGVIATLVSFGIIGGIQALRASRPSLLWWGAEQDTEATAAILGVLAGGWMAIRNWLKNITVFVVCCSMFMGALSGCTTTLGPGGLTITGNADSAAQMAPTVISVSRSIAEMVSKIAAERDAQKQAQLAVKLKAEQDRLKTILDFVGQAAGGPK